MKSTSVKIIPKPQCVEAINIQQEMDKHFYKWINLSTIYVEQMSSCGY